MQKMLPQEFHVLNDRYVIKTRVAPENISERDLMLRVRAANLSPGDMLTVQCFDHGYGTLLAEAEYRVTGRSDEMKRVEEQNGTRQFTETTFHLAIKGDWWTAPGQGSEEPAPATIVHKGGGTFLVLDGGGNEIACFTKEEGGKAAAEQYLAQAHEAAA
jgi:hypothetical protein